MSKVTVKYFNKEIEYLTEVIWRLGLVDNLSKAAKQQNIKGMENILEEFKVHHADVWQRMIELCQDYEEERFPTIYCEMQISYCLVFDSNKINPINLICLFAVCEKKTDYLGWLFASIQILPKALRKEGYDKIADYYAKKHSINSLEELMVAFNQK